MKRGPLSLPLGDLTGIPILTSRFVPRGSYYTTGSSAGGPGSVLCHPDQVVLLEAGLDAVRIVHEGLADVLEWLGDSYPPKPAPRNRPMPRRDFEPMLDRIRGIAARIGEDMARAVVLATQTSTRLTAYAELAAARRDVFRVTGS